mmetsp:Transcript_68290/g.192546  ORF Transcript_68290/g.192546 Transcript_68290/m.192546 type:complete len:387 (-) Transcript_68290:80-1240(-)
MPGGGAMSKQRKAPKQHRHAPSGETCRWVAKSSKKEGKRKENEETLDEFRSEWQELPDEDSASNRDYYFNSYAHFGIHEDMLKDQVRTGSYMKAIQLSRHLIEGKTVLDVGSGTGILCLFAAKAGARRCIGIECSDIAEYATEIARKNGYGDTITYVRGKVEEVELPVDTVDIIISEWMGYFLIYESMLDSVLFARDKWLVKDGLMFPDHARLYMAGIEDADYKEEKIGFWDQLWGFEFSPMRQMVMQEPISDTVDESAIVTSQHCILEINLHTAKREDLDFLSPYSLRVTRKDFIHALVVWFDVTFGACKPNIILSTAPGKPYTHWKQTVLYFEDTVVAHKGDVLSGLLAVRKSQQNPRDLDVKISFEFDGEFHCPRKVQYYRLR